MPNQKREELSIFSSGFLPNILAQHLFTSFMWTVAEKLPENFLRQGISSNELDVTIEDSHEFSTHRFAETWSRPTLRHRQLTKLIQQQVGFGLGTRDEILLCMIPAFSSMDLLPNHVILKLIPQVGSGQGWTETAQCYNKLLEQSMGATARDTMTERFCYNALIATIDFLLFASEPYDEQFPAPAELNFELQNIVARLACNKFVPVIKNLAPAYYIQRRLTHIKTIFELFGKISSIERIASSFRFPDAFGRPDIRECFDALNSLPSASQFPFFVRMFGFSEPHIAMYQNLSGAACNVYALCIPKSSLI